MKVIIYEVQERDQNAMEDRKESVFQVPININANIHKQFDH